MKTSFIVAAVLFAAAATTGAAYADNDKPAAPKAAEVKAEKAAVKPHSHVQEKTGMPQMMAQSKADKPTATKEQDKHYHPRDGK